MKKVLKAAFDYVVTLLVLLLIIAIELAMDIGLIMAIILIVGIFNPAVAISFETVTIGLLVLCLINIIIKNA